MEDPASVIFVQEQGTDRQRMMHIRPLRSILIPERVQLYEATRATIGAPSVMMLLWISPSVSECRLDKC